MHFDEYQKEILIIYRRFNTEKEQFSFALLGMTESIGHLAFNLRTAPLRNNHHNQKQDAIIQLGYCLAFLAILCGVTELPLSRLVTNNESLSSGLQIDELLAIAKLSQVVSLALSDVAWYESFNQTRPFHLFRVCRQTEIFNAIVEYAIALDTDLNTLAEINIKHLRKAQLDQKAPLLSSLAAFPPIFLEFPR